MNNIWIIASVSCLTYSSFFQLLPILYLTARKKNPFMNFYQYLIPLLMKLEFAYSKLLCLRLIFPPSFPKIFISSY